MLFNSLEYLIFFPIVFFTYWFLLHKSVTKQNILLLIGSYIFYGWWDWRFLSLIIISSTVDYVIGLKIGKETNNKKRKLLLLASILVNLGFLGYFKYYNFFIESFTQLLGTIGIPFNTSTLYIILPVGISFYTFQTLSYTIDIYKKKITPTKNILSFFTFVAFFPQLVAGPIERARNLLPQFNNPRTFDYGIASSGVKIILLGFFKKVVIADKVSILVDAVFNDPSSYTGFPLLVGTILFAVQIYCDFSGYSDIAIGTARLFGFSLMSNFNKPYYSKSLTEFWRRWHISLSSWFKDYVYIGLGGNRVKKPRWAFNLMVTFAVSGLWHGANWTFVIWGAYHGIILIIEQLILPLRIKIAEICNKTLLKGASVFLTFSIVCLGWIFFRAESVSEAFYIISNLFTDVSDYADFVKMSIKFRGFGFKLSDIFEIAAFIGILESIQLIDRNTNWWKVLAKQPLLVRWGIYYVLLISIIFWGLENTAQNFIYFQF